MDLNNQQIGQENSPYQGSFTPNSNDNQQPDNIYARQNQQNMTPKKQIGSFILGEGDKKEAMLDKDGRKNRTNNMAEVIIDEQRDWVVLRIFKRIFRDFSTDTITFHIFAMNCVMWIIQLFLYYYFIFHVRPDNLSQTEKQAYRSTAWKCIQIRFYGKYQPDVLYLYQIWRIILSGFVFNSWAQFYFNNFAFSMLGYSLEKENKVKFIVCFLSAMAMGNLLGSCFGPVDHVSTGISCGTIGLIPIEVIRYFRLRITNPILAKKRLRFIVLVVFFNFILNILSLFGVGKVDWIAHLGAFISAILTVFFFRDIFEVFCPNVLTTRRAMFRIIQGATLFVFIGMFTWMLVYGYVFKADSQATIQAYKSNKFLCEKFI